MLAVSLSFGFEDGLSCGERTNGVKRVTQSRVLILCYNRRTLFQWTFVDWNRKNKDRFALEIYTHRGVWMISSCSIGIIFDLLFALGRFLLRWFFGFSLLLRFAGLLLGHSRGCLGFLALFRWRWTLVASLCILVIRRVNRGVTVVLECIVFFFTTLKIFIFFFVVVALILKSISERSVDGRERRSTTNVIIVIFPFLTFVLNTVEIDISIFHFVNTISHLLVLERRTNSRFGLSLSLACFLPNCLPHESGLLSNWESPTSTSILLWKTTRLFGDPTKTTRKFLLINVTKHLRASALQQNFEVKCSTGRCIRPIETTRDDVVTINVDRWFGNVDETTFQRIEKTSRGFVSATDTLRSAFAKQRRRRHIVRRWESLSEIQSTWRKNQEQWYVFRWSLETIGRRYRDKDLPFSSGDCCRTFPQWLL